MEELIDSKYLPFKHLFRFWDRLITFVRPHPLTALPIDTDFSLGYKHKDACKVFFTITYIKLSNMNDIEISSESEMDLLIQS